MVCVTGARLFAARNKLALDAMLVHFSISGKLKSVCSSRVSAAAL